MQRLKNQEDTNFSIANPLAIMMKRPKENIGLIFREGTTPDTILETTNDTCHHRLLKKKTTMTRKRLISVTESDPSQKILRNSEMSNDHHKIFRSFSSPDYIELDHSVPERVSRKNCKNHPEISTIDLNSRLSPLPSDEFISSSSVLTYRVKSRSYLRKIESNKAIEDSHELSNCFDQRVEDENLKRYLRLKFDYHPNVACRVNFDDSLSTNIKKGKSFMFFITYRLSLKIIEMFYRLIIGHIFFTFK